MTEIPTTSLIVGAVITVAAEPIYLSSNEPSLQNRVRFIAKSLLTGYPNLATIATGAFIGTLVLDTNIHPLAIGAPILALLHFQSFAEPQTMLLNEKQIASLLAGDNFINLSPGATSYIIKSAMQPAESMA
jgi:hypothetical protein